jgi:transposase
MARKNYSEEFRRQAVDLYKSTPGATLRGIPAGLGIERATLARWVEVYSSGKEDDRRRRHCQQLFSGPPA